MNKTCNEGRIPNGIELCEDRCRCGGNLRLHTHNFKSKVGRSIPRYYIDCDNHCGCVSDWHDSIDEAIDAFDQEFGFGAEDYIVSTPLQV